MVALSRLREPTGSLFGPPPGQGWSVGGLFAAITIVLVALDGWQFGVSLRSVLAAAILVTAGAAVFLPTDGADAGRLGAQYAWIAALSAAAAQAVTAWEANVPGDGYAPWDTRGATIICAVLILRGQWLAGWTGALVGYAVSMTASASGEGLPSDWPVTLLRQAGALVVVQVLAYLLERNQRALGHLRDNEMALLAAAHARNSVLEQRRDESGLILKLAAEPLRRAAAGESSKNLQLQAMLAEGAVRDILRGRRFARGMVPAAARGARARGIDVILLDDIGDEVDPQIQGQASDLPAAALNWIARRLNESEPPRATVRLTRGQSRNSFTVSFYAESSRRPPEFRTFDS